MKQADMPKSGTCRSKAQRIRTGENDVLPKIPPSLIVLRNSAQVFGRHILRHTNLGAQWVEQSLFGESLCCSLNNLRDFRWPPKPTRSRERHENRVWKSWVSRHSSRGGFEIAVKQLQLQGNGRSAMPCKEATETQRRPRNLYRGHE